MTYPAPPLVHAIYTSALMASFLLTGMAVRSGEGLGGPLSRSARTRSSDSQQVHAGDSGHSSRLGNRTHCLRLDRLGQVAVQTLKTTVWTSSGGLDELHTRSPFMATCLRDIRPRRPYLPMSSFHCSGFASMKRPRSCLASSRSRSITSMP